MDKEALYKEIGKIQHKIKYHIADMVKLQDDIDTLILKLEDKK